MKYILFDELCSLYTRENFHDSDIESFLWKYEEKILVLEITHWRDITGSESEIFVKSSLTFSNVTDLTVEWGAELLFKESEITRFTEENVSNSKKYTIIGAKGWGVYFYAESIEYSEKELEVSEN
jgi:hypothetical protein